MGYMFTCGVIVSPVGGGRCEEQPGAALTMFSLANGMSTTRWFEFELQREEGKQLPQVCGWRPASHVPFIYDLNGVPGHPLVLPRPSLAVAESPTLRSRRHARL